MAEKQLRKMSRAELIEIIYALQQDEKTIRAENEGLRRTLDDRIVRIESAGSIAEAALSLNHIFEDAQKAAEQYLASVKEAYTCETKTENKSELQKPEGEASFEAFEVRNEMVLEKSNVEAEKLLEEARSQAVRIVDQANERAAEMIFEAQSQAQEELNQAEEVWRKLEKKAEAFKEQRRRFIEEATAFLHQHPELAEQMEEKSGKGGQQ